MVTMTGKELIIYILKNDLENKVVLSNGIFTGIITAHEVAVKFHVGVPTVEAWYKLGMIPGFTFGGALFFMKDVKDPRESNNKGADRDE